MKIDAYTKVVLTGIAVFLGVIAFDYKPTINAQAASAGGVGMIADISNLTGATKRVWHLKNGKIRLCYFDKGKTHCSGWSD